MVRLRHGIAQICLKGLSMIPCFRMCAEIMYSHTMSPYDMFQRHKLMPGLDYDMSLSGFYSIPESVCSRNA